MAKAVLISIRPDWVEKILSGEKTLEVRKTRPKLETPFKVYIYCTAGNLGYKVNNGIRKTVVKEKFCPSCGAKMEMDDNHENFSSQA